MTNRTGREFDVAVAGAGLAGLTAAVALAKAGFDVANIAPGSSRADMRTTALLGGSVSFLERLGVWEKVADKASPLRTMRLIDDTGRLFRAPQVDFRSAEIGLPAFGYNIANQALADALLAAAKSGGVTRIEAGVADASFGREGATLSLSDGSTLTCALAVGADGRRSALRQAAGIGAVEWSYPQTAIVLDFSHELPHGDVSTEFHTPHGPFTIVPRGDRRSSLVWVDRHQRADQVMAMDAATLERAVEDRMHSMLGKVKVTSPAQAWPLSGMTARACGSGPLVLVGEAAHVFPPIGAQGFNLGIRDVELVGRLAVEAGPGRLSSIGDAYSRRRAGDIGLRTASVDIMNRSLLSGFLPVQMARAIALSALGAVSPLRRLAMREGISPGGHFRHLAERFHLSAGRASTG